MAKLTVKNVGPIREAELDVKKHTVFIGPQGTGKSTLAKLIAMCCDSNVFKDEDRISLLNKYAFDGWLGGNSEVSFSDENYGIVLDDYIEVFVHKPEFSSIFSKRTNWLERKQDLVNVKNGIDDTIFWERLEDAENTLIDTIKKMIPFSSVYIPAERNLMALLSANLWTLNSFNTNFSHIITSFGRKFENATRQIKSLPIEFLSVTYENINGNNQIFYSKNNTDTIPLSQSASGHQTVIPLVITTEYLRKFGRLFIVEEPELNLYPTAQKDLIYSLTGGLQSNVSYQEAEWVFTTHSPYVLSSFNTLILAYKVGNQSDKLRAEVEKIIPSRCWINPDEFAAYYVDNGTVRSIVNPQTGLIADNELDDVSEELADEQDKLLALRRSVTRA